MNCTVYDPATFSLNVIICTTSVPEFITVHYPHSVDVHRLVSFSGNNYCGSFKSDSDQAAPVNGLISVKGRYLFSLFVSNAINVPSLIIYVEPFSRYYVGVAV